MKQGMTIQERLKDLRVERHLKLDDVAAATGISKSALGNYENDDYKEINHGSDTGKILWSVYGLPSLPNRKQELPKHGTYRTSSK